MINFQQARSIAEIIKRKEFSKINPEIFSTENYQSIIDEKFHGCDDFWIFYPLRSIKISHDLNMHETSIIVRKDGKVLWGKNYLDDDEKALSYIDAITDMKMSGDYDLMFSDPCL
jgi:hypothetical protein